MQNKFLQAISSQEFVDAKLIGDLKNQYFGDLYKRPEYYAGFLVDENSPWAGGAYTRAIEHDVKRANIQAPPIEIRAFPAPVFHVRPHNITDGNGIS